MIADPLTKGLPPKVFHEHVAHMGVLQFEKSEVYWEIVIFICFMFYV